MNETDTRRHMLEMYREFPDSPCAGCTGEIAKMCNRYKLCGRYRAWLGKVWRETQELLGATDGTREEWIKKGKLGENGEEI